MGKSARLFRANSLTVGGENQTCVAQRQKVSCLYCFLFFVFIHEMGFFIPLEKIYIIMSCGTNASSFRFSVFLEDPNTVKLQLFRPWLGIWNDLQRGPFFTHIKTQTCSLEPEEHKYKHHLTFLRQHELNSKNKWLVKSGTFFHKWILHLFLRLLSRLQHLLLNLYISKSKVVRICGNVPARLMSITSVSAGLRTSYGKEIRKRKVAVVAYYDTHSLFW